MRKCKLGAAVQIWGPDIKLAVWREPLLCNVYCVWFTVNSLLSKGYYLRFTDCSLQVTVYGSQFTSKVHSLQITVY